MMSTILNSLYNYPNIHEKQQRKLKFNEKNQVHFRRNDLVSINIEETPTLKKDVHEGKRDKKKFRP